MQVEVRKSTTTQEDFLNVERQLKALTFKAGKTSNSFGCQLLPGNPLGRVPSVHIKAAGLGICGKKNANQRGIQVQEYDGGSKMFCKLNLVLKAEEQVELKEMCLGIFNAWMKKHSPSLRSQEYEGMFSNQLTDGSKVGIATKGLINTDILKTMDIPLDHFNSPANTYGSFLFDSEEGGFSGPWYKSLELSEGFPAKDDRPATDHRVMFFDDKGRQIGTKMEDEVEVYKKGGVPLLSKKALDILTKSEFYKKGRWVCSCVVQVYGFHLNVGRDSSNEYVVYPQFRIRTSGSFRMQQVAKIDDPKALSWDQRTSIMDALVFQGVAGPTKKRKRAVTTTTQRSPSKTSKTPNKAIPKDGVCTDGESESEDDE